MKRIPQLDGVRALAILAVFIHHAFEIRMLWMGVDLFFILSGFLITGILLKAKHLTLGGFFAHFYARRALRILPPYVLLLVFVSIFFGVAWMQHWYLYILLTNVLLPMHIPHPVAFDPLWSLAVEEQFYLVWPFAVYFLDTRHLRSLSILLIMLAPLLRGALHFQEEWPMHTLTPFRMDLLAAGALLWLEWQRNRDGIERSGTKVGVLLALLGFVGFGLLIHYHISTSGNSRIGNVFIYESSLCICFGFMIYALAGWRVEWLCLKPLTYIGQISYSMYLVHLSILILIGTYFHRGIAALIALALSVLYAALSWHFMESRLLGHKLLRAR